MEVELTAEDAYDGSTEQARFDEMMMAEAIKEAMNRH